MSLNSFSSEDKIRAGIVQPKPWKNVGLIERPDHYHKAFRGNGVQKLYYYIGEVAELMGVEPSAVRFYEQELGLEPARRTRNGNRQYVAAEVEVMKLIGEAVKDLHINSVKRLLKEGGIERVQEVVDVLRKIGVQNG